MARVRVVPVITSGGGTTDEEGVIEEDRRLIASIGEHRARKTHGDVVEVLHADGTDGDVARGRRFAALGS